MKKQTQKEIVINQLYKKGSVSNFWTEEETNKKTNKKIT